MKMKRLMKLSLFAGLVAGCASAPVLTTSMPLAEREALSCKYNIERMGEQFSRSDRKLSERAVKQWESIKCPVAKEPTYAGSLRASVGKAGKATVVYCEGTYHAAAGYPQDYPRWDPEKGEVMESPQGQKVPTGMQLPLPEDAQIVGSYEYQGSVRATFKTGEDMKALAEQYHQLLSPGVQNVLADRNGKAGASGKLGGIPYSVSLDIENGTFTVTWDPPVSVPKKD